MAFHLSMVEVIPSCSSEWGGRGCPSHNPQTSVHHNGPARVRTKESALCFWMLINQDSVQFQHTYKQWNTIKDITPLSSSDKTLLNIYLQIDTTKRRSPFSGKTFIKAYTYLLITLRGVHHSVTRRLQCWNLISIGRSTISQKRYSFYIFLMRPTINHSLHLSTRPIRYA